MKLDIHDWKIFLRLLIIVLGMLSIYGSWKKYQNITKEQENEAIYRLYFKNRQHY